MLAWVFAMLIGLVMIYSTSSMLAESKFGSHLYFFVQQLVWTLLALGSVWVILRIDIKEYAVYSTLVMFVILVALSIVFAMPARNGAHRWLFVGPLAVQPSELFKFAMIVYLAFSLSNPKRDLSRLKQLLFPYVPLVGLGLLLILAEPDLGSTIVILATALVMFYLGGARMKHLAFALLPSAGLSAFVVFVLGYKKSRILDYMTALADPLQGSYQAKQAALTFGAGGMFGTGIGEGSQKLFFLPYPHTDFVFAAIGEEVGFVGLIVILALLFYIIWRGLHIASAQPDRFGFLLASGMTLSLFISIAVNIGVVTSLLPVTGLPLPFLSYGGSSLLVSSAAIGVLLNLSRRMVRT